MNFCFRLSLLGALLFYEPVAAHDSLPQWQLTRTVTGVYEPATKFRKPPYLSLITDRGRLGQG